MKLGLAFSGGKDSWACLWLNQDRLREITVLWVDTGMNYPELLETIERARAMCPNFVRIPSDRRGQNERRGLPSDVIPVQWTTLGQIMSGPKPITLQPYLACCFENVALPLHEAAVRHGVTHLIRGQRNEEKHKSPSRNGTVVDDGVTYLHPIEDWTEAQVMAYLEAHMEIPEHFKLRHSSMDCHDCTAYADESADRVEFMRQHHPDLHAQYLDRMAQVKTALSEAMRPYQ